MWFAYKHLPGIVSYKKYGCGDVRKVWFAWYNSDQICRGLRPPWEESRIFEICDSSVVAKVGRPLYKWRAGSQGALIV